MPFSTKNMVFGLIIELIEALPESGVLLCPLRTEPFGVERKFLRRLATTKHRRFRLNTNCAGVIHLRRTIVGVSPNFFRKLID